MNALIEYQCPGAARSRSSMTFIIPLKHGHIAADPQRQMQVGKMRWPIGDNIDWEHQRVWVMLRIRFTKFNKPASGSGLIASIFAPARFASCSEDIIRGAFDPGFCPITITRSVFLKSDNRTEALPRPIDLAQGDSGRLVAHV